MSQSGAPWGVVSDKVVCGVWCSGWRPMGCGVRGGAQRWRLAVRGGARRGVVFGRAAAAEAAVVSEAETRSIECARLGAKHTVSTE
eukprot:COSAG01_NODE_669_length_14379_cov_292.353011_7_plen_86_part_00